MAVRETASGADNVFLDDLKDFVRTANQDKIEEVCFREYEYGRE